MPENPANVSRRLADISPRRKYSSYWRKVGQQPGASFQRENNLFTFATIFPCESDAIEIFGNKYKAQFFRKLRALKHKQFRWLPNIRFEKKSTWDKYRQSNCKSRLKCDLIPKTRQTNEGRGSGDALISDIKNTDRLPIWGGHIKDKVDVWVGRAPGRL